MLDARARPFDVERAIPPDDPPRRIGLVSATMLVVASMIGVGVFTTTGLLVRDVQSTTAVLVAWLVGAILALCGALSYAELGALLPENGGEYQLLSRIFHPAAGFVAGWVSFVVGFSAPLAAVSIAFGEYSARIVPGLSPGVAALVALSTFSVLHTVRVSIGSGVQSVVAATQALLMLAFIVIGVWQAEPGRFLGDADYAATAKAIASPSFAVGLIYVSFSYSGWNAAAYIAGEIEDPERNVPRALILGTASVGLLYVGVNAVFLMSAPPDALSGVVEIAHVAAEHLFGPNAARAVSAIVALGLLASIGALLMTGARIYEAVGRDYPALRVLAWRGRNTGPFVGIGLQATAAVLMALTATFDGLLTYIGFTLALSSLFTIAGLFVLRRKRPVTEQQYRVWGYPVTPLLAIAILAWTVVHSLLERPVASAVGIGTMLVGLLVYFAVRSGSQAPGEPR
jgi:APA family basic amino acid/polyamine antiporter